VLASSVEVLRRANLAPALLPPLSDIDRPEDLSVWRRIVEDEEKDLRLISVIMPALNEAENIAMAVKAAAAERPQEILVVDGGSTDATTELAREAGARVLQCRAGRSRQMNCGAARASGNALLFVHADTLLPRGYAACVARELAQPHLAAGAFRFKIRAQFPGRNMIERATNLRSRWLQMPYGDQGLFMRRALFEELGGFAPLPILEDYDLVRRLRHHGRVLTVPLEASTSGRRWHRLGLVRTTLINQLILLGFHLGWPPESLAAIYRRTAQ
jgi:rSAM/selenodomain-associated transferase 2